MKHLSVNQRYQIQSLLKLGISHRSIADQIGVHHSTVSREVKRNSNSFSYKALKAEAICRGRHRDKSKHKRFSPSIEREVCQLLGKDYSPDQISGYCKVNKISMVSHETIYQYIWKDKQNGGVLYTHLRHRGRKRRVRGHSKHSRSRIPNRKDIDDRPKIVETRSRFGDLEIDTIIGKGRQGAIVTINDRKTGYLWARKIPVRSAAWTAHVTQEALLALKGTIKTITSDNGLEFTNHEQIAAELEVDFYFAHRYKSYQRGSNENLNGLLRQYIPKKMHLSKVNEKQLQEFCSKINNRPRKRFKYKSPKFMLTQELNNLGVAFMS